MIVRMMGADESGTVAAITRKCAEAAQWTAADYLKLAGQHLTNAPQSNSGAVWYGQGGCVLLAEVDGAVQGFAAVRAVVDELEVLNVGVLPGQRHRGVGSALLQAAFAAARNAGARAAFCEVRESNTGAQAFYQRHGFVRAGRRLRYYADPVEDGLVMAKHLARAEP